MVAGVGRGKGGSGFGEGWGEWRWCEVVGGGGGEQERKFGLENGALLNSSNHFLLFWCTFLLTMKKSLLTRNFRSYQT